jgi:hypothetical protein
VPGALSGATLAAFVRRRADHRGQLRLDQRLVQRLGRGADAVIDAGNFERLDQLEQADWSRASHGLSLRVFLGGFTQKIHAATSCTPALEHLDEPLSSADALSQTLKRNSTTSPSCMT